MKILIVCEEPVADSAPDANSWIHIEAGKLLASSRVTTVTVSELGTASVRHPRVWDWLVEAELADDADPEAVTDEPAFGALVHELRSRRMHPVVVLLDPARRSRFSPAGS